MKLKTVTYVSWSDLTANISQDWAEAVSSAIGDNVSWGDSRHTLILAHDVYANIGSPDSGITSWLDRDDDSNDDADKHAEQVFMQRLKELPEGTMIDMET
jgi:hypothetical protein